MCTDKLTYTVNEQNNTYHSTINIKPAGVKSSTYIEIDVENKENDLKFEVGDYVRISNYINILLKDYTHSWSEEVFVIKKVKKGWFG